MIDAMATNYCQRTFGQASYFCEKRRRGVDNIRQLHRHATGS
jgi:hypothetical protein